MILKKELVGMLLAGVCFSGFGHQLLAVESRSDGIAKLRPLLETQRYLPDEPLLLTVDSEMDVAAAADATNDPELYFLAARLYEFGYKLPPDKQRARECYSKAASLGHSESKLRMAWYLVEDEDTASNRLRAVQMVKEVAQKGNQTAEINLAIMQVSGFEGEANKTAGVEALKELADRGVVDAQYAFGVALLNDGRPRDGEEAFKWLALAAKEGFPQAQFQLGVCYRFGLGVERSYEESFEWMMKAANKGVIEAQHNVANAYLNGRGVERDKEKAIEWGRRSAKNGFTESMVLLGAALLSESCPSQENIDEALSWVEKAFARGHRCAECMLGMIYLDGLLVNRDVEKGMLHLRSAAEHGELKAQQALEKLSDNGNGR